MAAAPSPPGRWGFAFDGSQASNPKYRPAARREGPAHFGDFFHRVARLRAARRGGRPTLYFYPGGAMVISRANIRSRPAAYYEALRRQLDYSSDPLEGHYMERSWFHIFNCDQTLPALAP